MFSQEQREAIDKTVTLIALLAIFACGFAAICYYLYGPMPVTQPQQNKPIELLGQPNTIHLAVDQKPSGEPVALGSPGRVITVAPSFATGHCFDIHWETDTDDGARINEVLTAVAEQLKHHQGSPRASDKKARALFSVLEALDQLNDTKEVSGEVP